MVNTIHVDGREVSWSSEWFPGAARFCCHKGYALVTVANWGFAEDTVRVCAFGRVWADLPITNETYGLIGADCVWMHLGCVDTMDRVHALWAQSRKAIREAGGRREMEYAGRTRLAIRMWTHACRAAEKAWRTLRDAYIYRHYSADRACSLPMNERCSAVASRLGVSPSAVEAVVSSVTPPRNLQYRFAVDILREAKHFAADWHGRTLAYGEAVS